MKNHLLTHHYKELLDFLNGLRIGVYVTDENGNTILVNDESCRTGGLTRPQVIGQNMRDLEEKGFIKESASLKSLKSGEEENIIQDLGDGGKVFVTARPRHRSGKIDYVVCTERDITEIEALKKMLKEDGDSKLKVKHGIEFSEKNKRASLEQGQVIVSDTKSRIIMDKLMRVARVDTTVLLTGESGVGKEVYANLIYKNSDRVGEPFVKVNCAAITENLIESELFGYEKGAFTGADKHGKTGYFEMANGGTIFLDEIGEVPLHLQSKLLRVIQEKEVLRVGGSKPVPLDVRLIAATNLDLIKAIEEGTFREDLYYRLNVMPIEIPPLRERKQDICPMAKNFTDMFSKRYRVEKTLMPDAIKALEAYAWPGNIRELRNVIERSVISFDGSEINKFQIENFLYPKEEQQEDLNYTEGSSLKEILEGHEKTVILQTLKRFQTAKEAAAELGMNKSTLCRRMKKYNIPIY